MPQNDRTQFAEKTRTGDLFTDLFLRLNAAETVYCVLRNYEGLPERIGNDVDMLVLPGSECAFEESLDRACDAAGWRLARKVRRFGFSSYWVVHRATRDALHIDVWTRLTWKGLPLVDAAEVARHRIRHKGFYVADGVSENTILLLKDLVQNGKIREKYYECIGGTASMHASRFEALLERTLGKNVAARLTQGAATGDWHTLDGYRDRIRWSLLCQGLFPNPLSAPVGLLRFLFGHIRSMFTDCNGMSVAFIGPDGSGKSSVAEGVAASLHSLFPAVRFFHGRFRIIPDLRSVFNVARKVFRRKPLPPSPSGVQAIHDVCPQSRLKTLIHIVYYSLDFILGHIPMRLARSRGQLVFLDRYYYDWFILSSLCHTPRWLLPVLEFIYPRPDVVIYLSNSPKTIRMRKPELPVAEIAMQGERCKWVAHRIINGVTIATDMELDKVVLAVADRILDIATSRCASEGRTLLENTGCASNQPL